MKLTPVSEQQDYFKIFVYGLPDAGKTTFSASGSDHPAFGVTAIMNLEKGLQSIRRSSAVQTPAITCESDIESVIMSIKGRANGWEKVQTLVVDSATEMQRILLEESIKSRMKKKPGSGSKPQLSDYGDLTATTRRLCGMLRDLPCNVIVTALEKAHRDTEEGPVTRVTPEMTDKACGALMGMFDNVWCLKKLPATKAVPASDGAEAVDAVDAHTMMLTQAHGVYAAKTRNAEFAALLPSAMVNPTLPEIYDIFQQSLGCDVESGLDGQARE